MSRLRPLFEELRRKNERALVLFLTAGDPDLASLPAILDALFEGGADLVEVGIPFSDPFGEGPVIQASSQRALAAGATPDGILAAMAECPPRPMVVMGYYNPLLRYGERRFAEKSANAGSWGTIVSDLVPDEADSWCQASVAAGLDTIFLVAPTSTEQRVDEVARSSTGFVYAVSRTGVTGDENQVPPDVRNLVERVKKRTDAPVCVGFGLSTPEHVRMVCEVADGAVVGSALVRRLHEDWQGGKGRPQIVGWVRDLKDATR